jgi:starch synthase
MYIVMAASECAPVAKVGGLGDVVFGLARELEIRGHTVEIVLPKYDCMRYDHIYGLQVTWEGLMVPWCDGRVPCTVWFGFVDGRKCFFIEPHSADHFFERGTYYGFPDEHLRFAFFSKAVMEFLLASGKRPDVLHTHDWQTALAPVLLCEIYAHHGMDHVRAMHTIHNFKHQGIAGAELLWTVGLNRPEYYCQPDRLQDDHNPTALNLMKGAITYANYTNTVSPRHAWEARYTDQGCGLGHTLHRFADKFGGILNGLDYEMWNPELDPYIAAHYTAATFERKADNKAALRRRLLVAESGKPLVAYVGRLDTQKGLHLIRHALHWSLENGAQFVLLGASPELGINDEFWHLKHHLNDLPDCHLEIGYDEELAHLIYAGADLMVVPSLYEPCGLTQMIALRYGTVPIVRSVGGLADTVFDRDHSDRPVAERNGFVFDHADFAGLESALRRALGLWNGKPAAFRQLALQGMACDYSWKRPGADYVNVYEWIRHK